MPVSVADVPMWLVSTGRIGHAVTLSNNGLHHIACDAVIVGGNTTKELPDRICRKCRNRLRQATITKRCPKCGGTGSIPTQRRDTHRPALIALVLMARAAQKDERLSDGALYGKLADEIERLHRELQLERETRREREDSDLLNDADSYG